MVSLSTVSRRFDLPFQVIEGGRGMIMATLSETDQNSQPSYVFVQPRHVLRTPFPTALRAGMVIQSPGGSPFIVGENGPSEQREGTLWESFRLFEPTGRYRLTRRTQVMDPIARQMKEGPIVEIGTIWAAMEPLDREQSDREMRVNFEQSRFITGSAVANGDLIDNRVVTKVDRQLGLAIGIVT